MHHIYKTAKTEACKHSHTKVDGHTDTPRSTKTTKAYAAAISRHHQGSTTDTLRNNGVKQYGTQSLQITGNTTTLSVKHDTLDIFP